MTRIAIALPLILVATHVLANPIGSAINVRPQASLESGGETVTLQIGKTVEANNKVVTGAAGATRLRFIDASLLEIGAGAAVTLDEFVYSGDKAEKAALTMSKGAFRWVTGQSEKKAYDLKTPLATIGIRGTDFRVDAEEAVTTIRLRSGAINACSRISQTCATIDQPGQGVRLFADGRLEMFMQDPRTIQPVTRFAALPPPAPPRQPPPRVRRAEAPAQAAPPPRRRTVAYTPPAPARAMRLVEEPLYADEPSYISPRRRPPVVVLDPPHRAPPRPCVYRRWSPECGGARPPRDPYGDDFVRPPRSYGEGGIRMPRGPYGEGGVRIPRGPYGEGGVRIPRGPVAQPMRPGFGGMGERPVIR